MSDVSELGACEQATLIEKRELSTEELMRATLARVEAVNGQVNAIVSLRDQDELLAEARAKDTGPVQGVLHGLPIAVKDLSNVAGMPTTQGSPAFAEHVAQTDDLHVARMRAAGAIFIGKTNTPEFGLGSHTYNPVHGATLNPYDKSVTAGGSSGGAAVALACRMVALADGSDMMGSLRNPAGWNNVYGMRPTWGRVPGEPVGDAYFHQISTNGPMARSPADLAILLQVMAGPDPRQPNSMAAENMTDIAGDVAGSRIGWLGDWGGAWPMEDGILPICEQALGVFQGLGCVVEAIAPPFSSTALWDSWTTLRSWSVAVGLAPLLERPETLGQIKDEALWEAERGQALTAMQVHGASIIRSNWYRRAAELFESYDALVVPTAQVWPFSASWQWPHQIGGQMMDTYHRWMEVTIPASLLGLPVVAVPAGFGARGLPMGMQLIGRRGDDIGMLRLAQAYHGVTQWPQKRPPPV